MLNKTFFAPDVVDFPTNLCPTVSRLPKNPFFDNKLVPIKPGCSELIVTFFYVIFQIKFS